MAVILNAISTGTLFRRKERKKVLVYVLAEHNEAASPLIEAEYCGTILKPGGPTGKNTNLEIIARNALGELSAQKDRQHGKIHPTGATHIEDLDTLAEPMRRPGKAVRSTDLS